MKIGFFKCSRKTNILCLFIFFYLSLYTNRLHAEDKKENALETKVTFEEINKLRDEVKEIRRDQLNYKIEKDLLKETYASNYQKIKETYESNYQTINIIIGLIMAFITIIGTILGYIGFKGISNLKKEYENELQKLRDIKEGFELKLKELVSAQLEVKGKLENVSTINEDQSKKIQMLELKEKAGSYVKSNDYKKALKYIAIGLDISPDDVELLNLNAACLSRLENFSEAIEVYTKILSIDQSNISAILNLAELFMIEEKFDSYNELINNKKHYLAFVDPDNMFITYFESVKSYMIGDETNLKSTIERFIKKLNYVNNKFRINYPELFIALRKKPDSRAKELLIRFAEFLEGRFDGIELKKMLDNPSYLTAIE